MVMFSRPKQQILSGKGWKIQRNKNEEIEKAVLELRKEHQVLVAERIERKGYRSMIQRMMEYRFGRNWDGDDDDRGYG
eukprot:702452-Ditylum_brightwellii.AAC.1